MAGTEGEDESTENAMRPPQSVVISSTEADEIPKSVDPPLLTGTVVAADVHAQTISQPIAQSQLQYVMGPDGQMYAYQKPPFNWKHFCLGLFIPVGIIFAQLLLSVMLTEDYDDWDYYDYVQNIDLEFTKYEGSALSLSLPPSNDYVITYCSISGEDFESYFCEFWYNDDISITKSGTTDQVGTVYKTNNTMYLEENFPSGNHTIYYEYVEQSRYQEWIELHQLGSQGLVVQKRINEQIENR